MTQKTFVVTQEVKDSVKEAITRFWQREPHTRRLERWAGGNFVQTEEELVPFLRVCRDAYINRDKSFFIRLGRAMRQKKSSSPPSKDIGKDNNLVAWLLVGWAGTDFVKSVLPMGPVDSMTVDSGSELLPEGYRHIPLCFYSVRALYSLHNEVLQLHPQTSEDNMKKTIQRLKLKRPPEAPWVKNVYVDAMDNIVFENRLGDAF